MSDGRALLERRVQEFFEELARRLGPKRVNL